MAKTQDAMIYSCPSIIYDPVNDLYKMYYIRHNSFDNEIRYAISKDKINWNDQGIILSKGKELKKFDNHIIEEFDKVDIHDPYVIYSPDDSKMPYKMWYSGYDGSYWRIGYATSKNSKIWSKQNVALDLGSPGDFDSNDVYCPSVIHDLNNTDIPYKMWYLGSNRSHSRIGYAESSDGKHWNKQGPVNSLRNPEHFNNNNNSICGFSIISNPNKPYIYEMLYLEFRYLNSQWIIGYATSSDGKVWLEKKITENRFNIHTPFIIYDPDDSEMPYKMWHSGLIKFHWTIGYTESKDGLNWKEPVPISMQ